MPLSSWLLTEPVLHFSLLLTAYLFLWWPILSGEFISDDHEGIERFSDRWDASQQQLIESYELDIRDPKTQQVVKRAFKHTAYNPQVEFPGGVIRWLRLLCGRHYQKVGENAQHQSVYGYVQQPRRHHLLSLILQGCNLVLLYWWLTLVTTPTIAFWATLFVAVHPLACQTVAWISGIGYLLALWWLLVSLLCVAYWPAVHWAMGVPVIAGLTFLSMCGLLSGFGNWLILASLGCGWAAAVAGGVALLRFVQQGIPLIRYRIDAFKEQQLGKLTEVSPRNLIFMIRTFGYYCALIPVPLHLGLYHRWSYHIDEETKRMDGWFAWGCLCLAGMVGLWSICPYRFALVWFVVYLALFLNLITAQQTVTDRYAFLSMIGYAVCLAWALQSYPILLGLLVGAYAMRTYLHLPTFKNELFFYASNYWNFPDHEVILGNFGVACHMVGLNDLAVYMWQLATKINPQYDVPWYNLYQMHRRYGLLGPAREFIQKCLDAKLCHFPKLWQEDRQLIEYEILLNQSFDSFTQRLTHAVQDAHYGDLT